MKSGANRSGHLFMRRAQLDDIGAESLPAGYLLRTYQTGDEAAWLWIIRSAYGGEWRDDAFERCVSCDEAFRPERLFFVTCDGIPVGTAGAFQKLIHGGMTGYVHMMAVDPMHQRKGIGNALVRACLGYFGAQGWQDAVLDTDETRLAAIRLYLRNGFQPQPEVPGDAERWARILRNLRA